MRSVLFFMGALAVCLLMQQSLGVAVAQENGTEAGAGVQTRATATSNLGAVDDAMSLGLTGERRPPYRLQRSDILEINFTFTPEFNQSLTVQPDGFITLKSLGTLYVEGRTVAELTDAVRQAYQAFLQDPEVTITLKDFQRPYFIAAGEVRHPGKYELRADTTVAEGLAISGGLTPQARESQVFVYHRMAGQWSEPQVLNLKKLLAKQSREEDLQLRSGDLLFVPQSTTAKVRKYLPPVNLGMYVNPAQY